MTDKQTKTLISFNFGWSFVLFLVFMTLRLCEVVDWSWWWITAPLWVPLALWIAVVIIWLLALFTVTIVCAMLE